VGGACKWRRIARARQSPGSNGETKHGTRPRLRRMTSGDCLRAKVRSALIASIRPTSHHSDGVSIAVATRSAFLLLSLFLLSALLLSLLLLPFSLTNRPSKAPWPVSLRARCWKKNPSGGPCGIDGTAFDTRINLGGGVGSV